MRCAMMVVLCWIALVVVRAQEWKPLFDGKTLAGWTTTPFGGSGEVAVADGALVLNMGMLTGVTYTNPIPTTDYEVELQARRMVGSDFFCGITFPVGSDFATLIVGGWGGSVVGISSLDGNDAAHNETTTYQRFEAGRWYAIRLAVTPTHLSVWIDGTRRIHANIEGKKISLRPGDIELSKPFGIASYSTTAELKDLRLRSLKAAPAGGGGGGAKKEAVQLPDALRADLDRLVAAATGSPVPHRRLSHLCDTFGPRYSGTTNLESATDWVLEELRRDGLENVRGEPVPVRRWRRGAESALLIAPHPESLPVLALGGTVGTPPDGITAPVLVVSSFAELSNRIAEARGRIVVFNAPFTDYGATVRFRWSGAIEAAKAGAVASLIRSVTPFSLRTPHTGAMSYQEGIPRIPHAALAPEDAERIARWQAAGITPVVQLTLGAETLPETTARNVIAELRGREHPDSVVVLGGHLDSWDIGQGAQDDAGGCLAAWEAVRLMRELGLRPRSTVRLVLWTDEENLGA
ncbi:MAG: M20/M25/M40 family metallo-hydrolase, partial [Verrucomicrobia bacterium]|nr:M20/M25/M40 family metallo-hydrolase [Verrucomicrobiota bacterium]